MYPLIEATRASAAPAPLVTSRNNAAIKTIRRLRSRRTRRESGLFFVESFRLVGEAVRRGADVQTLIATPAALQATAGAQILAALARSGVPCVTVTPEVFASLSVREGPEGIGAVVRQRWHTLDEVRPRAELCWVALDAVQHPGNLGTILRACDAVGAAGVFLLGQATDPYDPMAVRASLGAVFSQRLVCSSFAGLLAWCRRHGAMLVGTSPSAPTGYRDLDYRPPMVLLMGRERGGLPGECLDECDLLARIPMVGRCDSLNVAVAAGVLLYHLFDRRGVGDTPATETAQLLPTRQIAGPTEAPQSVI